MDYLPVFMRVTDRPVLVVGGGDEAARKVTLLLRAQARVRIVAPWLCAALAQLRVQGRIEHDAAAFCAQHLADVCIVLVASDDDALKQDVARLATQLNVPVNVVDTPQLCTFIIPAIVDRSPVIVAVSSAGTSPVLTTMIRARIEMMLEPGIGRLAQWAGRWRERVKGAIDGGRARRVFWERVLNSPLATTVVGGDEINHNEQWADAQLRALLADAPNVSHAGRVDFIESGPGSADLLTLRAARLLREADVIVYDSGVADDVLELARRDSTRIDVSDTHRQQNNRRRKSSNSIGALLVQLASEGQRVARVKRAGPCELRLDSNETKALGIAGISYQMVPCVARTESGGHTVQIAPAVAA